jgi:hypothetical protein
VIEDREAAAPDQSAVRRTPAFWVRYATVALVTVVAALGYLGQGRHHIVVRPGDAVFDDRILPTFYSMFLVSAVVALKWPLVGGVLTIFTAAGISPFAVTQLRPWSAATVILVFAVPAVVCLVLGLRHRTPPGPDEPDLSAGALRDRRRGRRHGRRIIGRPLRVHPDLGTDPSRERHAGTPRFLRSTGSGRAR